MQSINFTKYKSVSLQITYIKHSDIDKIKWDQCIAGSANSLMYGYSYFLDIMSKNWDALVIKEGDIYKKVMPLTWNKKFGIAYLRQPPFTQQLGIFGNFIIDEKLTEAFINKALEIFPFAEINLNYANEYKSELPKKSNLILHLNHPFADIEKAFRKDFVKNIKSKSLNYLPFDDIEKVVQLFKEHYHHKVHISPNAYQDWVRLCHLLKTKDQLLIRKVCNGDSGILSTAIFLKDDRRIYYIMSVTSTSGRKQQSNYYLLYHLIKEFAGNELIFDFEGSNIPSIQQFFLKFGAVNQPYPSIRINNLPLWKRWIKNGYDTLKRRP